MRGFLTGVFLLWTTASAAAGPAAVPRLDLGDIPRRPPAPEFSFDRFYQTQPLGQLAFSPDGKRLYFTRSDGRVDNVFVMDPATRRVRQLSRFDESVAAFAVARSGGFLVLVMDVGGNENFDLYRFDPASGRRTRLTDAGHGDTTLLCGLSPDDRTIYYAQTQGHRREAGLWSLDLASGRTHELIAARGRTLDCDAVSDDGRYLLYGELIGFDERHLGLLDLDSGETRIIDATPGVNNVDGNFAGAQVYFRSARDANRFRLWRYDIARGTARPVTLPFDNDLASLEMFAGGRVAVIGYRSALAGRTAIFVDDFSEPRDYGFPANDIVGAVFSREDPALGILFVERADMPRRYYLVGRGPARLVYDSNRSGIDPADFAEARSTLIPSFDGLPVPTHFFIPNGTSARRRRAAVLLIHGGPDDLIDPLYLSNVQFLANRGFIVVAPNVRGSAGFGKAFAALDDGDWGGGHVRDIVSVAEAVRRLDFVDGEHLFVIGTSFGGFSVMSLLVQYPCVFRAAVDFFGFTELASFVDSWPFYLQRHIVEQIGFDPRIDRLRNRALSPIYHVDRIAIPLQIHQGANDARVPRQQSDWLVARLRQSGRPVEYYVYPQEGHGFTRFEDERLAWQRVVTFLRRYQSRAIPGSGVKGPSSSRCHHRPSASPAGSVKR